MGARAIEMQKETRLELMMKEAEQQNLAIQKMAHDINGHKAAALKQQKESEIQIHNERLRESNRGVNARKEDLWKEHEYYFEHSTGRWFAGVFSLGIAEGAAAAGRAR